MVCSTPKFEESWIKGPFSKVQAERESGLPSRQCGTEVGCVPTPRFEEEVWKSLGPWVVCFSGGKGCLRNRCSLSPSAFLLCQPVLCQAHRAQEQWGGPCLDSYWRLQNTAGSGKGQGDRGANGSSAQGEWWIVKWSESRWNCLRIPCKAFPSSPPHPRKITQRHFCSSFRNGNGATRPGFLLLRLCHTYFQSC